MLVTLGVCDAMLGEHAAVLGASMSGLLAARVLADHFQTVTVVDRDELPDEPVNRRGVPQGRHVHALLAGGSMALETFFPGILHELRVSGGRRTRRRRSIQGLLIIWRIRHAALWAWEEFRSHSRLRLPGQSAVPGIPRPAPLDVAAERHH